MCDDVGVSFSADFIVHPCQGEEFREALRALVAELVDEWNEAIVDYGVD